MPVREAEQQSGRATEKVSRLPLIVAGLSCVSLAVAGYMWLARDNTAVPASVSPAVVSPPAASVDPVPPKSVEPAATTTTVPPSIEPVADGLIKLDIKPWGTVAVDGVTRGVSPPLKQLQLSVGTHVIEIANPPAAPLKRTVEITRDTPFILSHTFK
jgi:hypothetical protein